MTDTTARTAAGPGPAILWYRQDLRLADHTALEAALNSGRPVLPVYVLDDASPGPWRMGGASRWWLHHSLQDLAQALARRGAPLVLRRGPAAEILPDLVAETGASAVHAGRMHEPWGRLVEAELARRLPAGMLHLHRTSTLFELDSIRTKTGGIYGVYGAFARQLRGLGSPAPPRPAPDHIPAPRPPRSDYLDTWGLLPSAPDWSQGLRTTWQPGLTAAQCRLAAFTGDAVDSYAARRNLPGQPGTSMVSPHLHWGELSPAEVWHAAERASVRRGQDLDTFLGELLWREFAAYLLWHNPHLPEQPLRPRFAAIWPEDRPAARRAWERGRTGIPIVDAGMHQLWHTGWMHNRVRMIVASFLTKHLLVPWQAGQAWFWDTLVDADLASNAASWQWVAGSGIDSQPFFRIFNPVSQGEKFDPDGAYVRAWVPELAGLPDRWLHAPWTAPGPVLTAAGVTLGTTYPNPVIDLAEGRNRALAAFRSMGQGAAA